MYDEQFGKCLGDCLIIHEDIIYKIHHKHEKNKTKTLSEQQQQQNSCLCMLFIWVLETDGKFLDMKMFG